jgi:hypothetical protein
MDAELELIGEEIGETTAMRVIQGEDAPQVEVSFRATGMILGVSEVNLGTYTALVRPDESLTGEGNGVMITEDGDMVSWRGLGLGRLRGPGDGAVWSVAMHYNTTSPRLARLNNLVGLLEYVTFDGVKIELNTYGWNISSGRRGDRTDHT